MTKFKSFNNSKQKLQTLWEQSEENKSEIDNLEKIQINYNSINFNKKINTIPVAHEIVTNPLANFGRVIVVQLNKFPEWIINHINVVPIISVIGDVNTDNVKQIIIDGNIETLPENPGDIGVFTEAKQWIAKLNENNYELKIAFTIFIVQVTPGDTINLPYNLDIDLKIINPRIYETSNNHKK